MRCEGCLFVVVVAESSHAVGADGSVVIEVEKYAKSELVEDAVSLHEKPCIATKTPTNTRNARRPRLGAEVEGGDDDVAMLT